MEVIKKYFHGLDTWQTERFKALFPLYQEWNSRINVISRKDMENFWVHHVLHSLSIACFVSFKPGTQVLDVGTGGGFPGIPLAIFFPETEFLLIDSIGKKIKIVKEITQSLGLKNVSALQTRAEDIKEPFDFVVSRAVKSLPEFIPWVSGNIKEKGGNQIENGILYLKGGEFGEEIRQLRMKASIFELKNWFSESYFETKKLVYLVPK
ncbi:MAG TPA: 16S rRNA (guanine(527)-N(7))-methyltransferase RsmG [Bacteroidales bacterium]|nr:16S rRNA (guanine(527)-N(7))-methyltransferase RsmG [Bacteroidales bacterium]